MYLDQFMIHKIQKSNPFEMSFYEEQIYHKMEDDIDNIKKYR